MTNKELKKAIKQQLKETKKLLKRKTDLDEGLEAMESIHLENELAAAEADFHKAELIQASKELS